MNEFIFSSPSYRDLGCDTNKNQVIYTAHQFTPNHTYQFRLIK